MSPRNHADKPSEKSKATHPNQKKPTVAELPDLEPILDAFTDAYAIVRSASYVLHECGIDAIDDGDEDLALIALRQGVTSFGLAVDLLQDAQDQLSRFQKAGGAS